jgi:hypothetical protein
MSYHDQSTTLLANCRQLCEDVQSFIESKFEGNFYNKINENINNINTLLDNLLSNLGNIENETDQNKLFILKLGIIKLNLDQIKNSINPNFWINNKNKRVITSFFPKNTLNGSLTILRGDLNSLENFINASNSHHQLKH